MDKVIESVYEKSGFDSENGVNWRLTLGFGKEWLVEACLKVQAEDGTDHAGLNKTYLAVLAEAFEVAKEFDKKFPDLLAKSHCAVRSTLRKEVSIATVSVLITSRIGGHWELFVKVGNRSV